MNFRYAILNEKHEVIPVSDVLEWARWFESSISIRRIKFDQIGDVEISTVFLGVNHAWLPNASPLWFETMIFGGEHDQYQDRCTTYEQAIEMHQVAVDLVKKL